MANPYGNNLGNQSALIEELRRFGLLGGPQSNAPQMPIPQLDPGVPAQIPVMPNMPAPAVGNPSEAVDMMFGGVPSKSPLMDSARSEWSKNYGGYDPVSGIDWNTGRGGQTFGKAMGK